MDRSQPGATSPAVPISDFTPFFKAFCSETRARIIEYLMRGEKCVCEISALLGGSQPLVSHHLAVLREAGFVSTRGQGARTYYAIDWDNLDARLGAFREATEQLRADDTGPSCICG